MFDLIVLYLYQIVDIVRSIRVQTPSGVKSLNHGDIITCRVLPACADAPQGKGKQVIELSIRSSRLVDVKAIDTTLSEKGFVETDKIPEENDLVSGMYCNSVTDSVAK